VSIRAETNLKLAVFYPCHQGRISRIVAPASIALTVVRSLHSTKEYEENFKVTAEQPVIKEKYWPRTMEAIHELFGSVLGETGVPLAYVVRANVEIPPVTDPSEGYITVAYEMIARAPHGNQAYANDSMEVWSYIVNITRARDFWTYVKPAQRTKDGITFLDTTTLITWLQKQKLSLDRSVILAKERVGPGKSAYKFMLNNMQCSMA
jgi:hypothetical protein